MLGCAWKPHSDGLLIASLVIDLAGRDKAVATGFLASPSHDRTGSLIAVSQRTGFGAAVPGQVLLYDAGGHPVVEVGPGDLPAFQP